MKKVSIVPEYKCPAQEGRDFGDFERRLGYDFERLNAMDLEYYGRTP